MSTEDEVAVKAEEEIEVIEEKLIPINFKKVWITPRKKRSPKAMRVLREIVKRHMKVEDVKISNEVNETVWAKGIEKPPRKMTIRAVKDKEGNVIVFPSESTSS